MVDLDRGPFVKLHDQATIVGLLAPQVWAGVGRKPEQVIVAMEMAGEEEVRAKDGDVFGKVPNWEVIVPSEEGRQEG